MEKIIQITAGRGPTECSWVVAQVLKQFLVATKAAGIQHTILQQEKGLLNATVQSVSIGLKGTNLDSFLTGWLGTIQWIGTSTMRKYHKRKNWFIGVFELPLAKQTPILDKDIRFKTMRSKGPGGQHVNKVNSAVRAMHLLTGIQVVAMDSRSQHQNKKLALARLKAKVNEANLEQLKGSLTNQWENHLNLQRGNPIRVFKGTDFKHQKENKKYKPKRQKLKTALKKEQWD